MKRYVWYTIIAVPMVPAAVYASYSLYFRTPICAMVEDYMYPVSNKSLDHRFSKIVKNIAENQQIKYSNYRKELSFYFDDIRSKFGDEELEKFIGEKFTLVPDRRLSPMNTQERLYSRLALIKGARLKCYSKYFNLDDQLSIGFYYSDDLHKQLKYVSVGLVATDLI